MRRIGRVADLIQKQRNLISGFSKDCFKPGFSIEPQDVEALSSQLFASISDLVEKREFYNANDVLKRLNHLYFENNKV